MPEPGMKVLERLGRIPEPNFLTPITAGNIVSEPFPLAAILKNSLYYPSSGFDTDPVTHLAGGILNFIYADYGRSREEFLSALERPGFHGHVLVAARQVAIQELAPAGWEPMNPVTLEGDPEEYSRIIEEPFCCWVVFEKRTGPVHSRGGARFSLLYLCAEGVSAFQGLFRANRAAPKAVAVIQPGHGLGFNWTNFEDPLGILARSVLENPAGGPEFLLFGGLGRGDRFDEPCWPDYCENVCFLPKSSGGRIGIWARSLQPGAKTIGYEPEPK